MAAPALASANSERVDPRAEYTRRRDAYRRAGMRHARWEAIAGNSRVIAFLLAALLAWFVFGARALFGGWLGLPLAGFVALVVWHERINRARTRAEQAVASYDLGLARLDDQWSGAGEAGTRFLNEEHPYAPDLDLFGRGSLYERLCRARTRDGEETLAAWLLAPASPDEILARQEAVAELRPRLDLREDLDLLGGDVRAVVNPEGLTAWGMAAPIRFSHHARRLAVVLSILAGGSFVAWLTYQFDALPPRVGIVAEMLLVLSVVLELFFTARLRGRIRRVTATIDQKERDLTLFATILARIEREQFVCPRLRQLRAALDTAGLPPSARVARLSQLVERLNWRRNQFFAPFAALVLWGTHHAFALESWRKASGPAIPRWLTAVGELEALCALAAYSFENPADPFPEVVADGPHFDGQGLGHPLIPVERCIRNDLRLGDPLRVLVVSGSNMSGKSTLLRTVGINVVLALAGAPVRAHSLRLSPLMPGATLRIQDSLQAGRSRFYAEIMRVRQLVDLSRETPPLLFLLDEIFQGTNSHDRRLGAEAVVHNLVEDGAIGLVTTHDLALTHIADQLAPRAANVHFEDHFEQGKMTFDYRMRPGVVRKSNALALMRAVGLHVPADEGGVPRSGARADLAGVSESPLPTQGPG